MQRREGTLGNEPFSPCPRITENIMIEKSKLNFTVDALMFVFMMALAGIGFLMKFDLIPGKERWLQYGRNVNLFWLGLDRHEWGTIHLVLGYILLGLLLLHIILHLRWIFNIYERVLTNRTIRILLATLFIIVSFLMILFSFIITPHVEEMGSGTGRIDNGDMHQRGNPSGHKRFFK
jgi:hypothetical protein